MNKKIISVILTIVFLIFFYFYSINSNKLLEQSQERENKEYPSIKKSKIDYSGLITKISESKYFSGHTLNIELNNGRNFAVSGTNENLNYETKNLQDNLKKGDSIYFDSKTYEFFIFRKDEIYKFKLQRHY